MRKLGKSPADDDAWSKPVAVLDARPELSVVATETAPRKRSIFQSIAGLRTFESLHDYGFRWFYWALLSQMASMNMQMLVRGYLAYKLTNSYGALGFVSLANAIPGLAFSLPGGVLADRVPQKKYVVQAGQLLSAANAGFVAFLLFTHALTFHILIGTAFAQGMIQALMMPARQAMLREVAGRKMLMNAVALSSAGMNSMRLLAPALGGVLIAIFGSDMVYTLMTLCYLAAAAFLLKVPQTTPDMLDHREDEDEYAFEHGHSRRDGSIRDGFKYVLNNQTLRGVLTVNLIFILLSMPYLQLLPGYVASVMHEGPDKLGFLLSVTGVGSLIGALAVASMPNRKRGLLFLISTLIQGIALIFFSASSWFLVAIPIMVVLGFGQAGRQSFSNVLVQEYTEDDYRGRVMSIYMLQFALMSFSTFLVGIISSFIGAQEALGGVAILLVIYCCYELVFDKRLRHLD